MAALRLVRCLGLLGLAAVIPSAASAQDVSVRAFLSLSSNVSVGQTFVLNVEMTGTQSLTESQIFRT